MSSGVSARRRQPRGLRSPVANHDVPPQPKLTERSHVVVLGESAMTVRVTRSIREIGVPCRRVTRPEQAGAMMNEHSRALLIVPPVQSLSVLEFARRIRGEGASVPIFVIMEGPLPSRTCRELYAAGIEAVFEWPFDARAVKRTVFRLVAPAVGRWGRAKTPTEVAIEETARAHLKAHAVPFGAQLGLEAVQRFVVLKGSLDALWKLELARQVVLEIPGVEDVVAQGVEISGSSGGDRATAKAVREVLRHAAAVEGTTLAVAVRSGVVTLTGSVRDKYEATRALDLVRQVRGVRRVQDYLVVTPQGKRRDQALARRLRKTLEIRHPETPVDLSVFGNVAVLCGRVPRARVRDAIKELVCAQEGVERVVDKLSVSRRRPR